MNQQTTNTVATVLNDLGWTDVAIADALDLQPKTVRRWRKGDAQPASATLKLLKTLAYGLGHLPGAGSAWQGWTLNKGILCEPGGTHAQHEHTPGSIRAWWWTAQQLQGLRHDENERERIIQDIPNVQRLHSGPTKAQRLTATLRDMLSDAAQEGKGGAL